MQHLRGNPLSAPAAHRLTPTGATTHSDARMRLIAALTNHVQCKLNVKSDALEITLASRSAKDAAATASATYHAHSEQFPANCDTSTQITSTGANSSAQLHLTSHRRT